MTQDQNKKTLRHFQCRDYLWEIFEQMSSELECSTDYLINEAMRQYARSRNYGTSQGPVSADTAPPARPTADANAAPAPIPSLRSGPGRPAAQTPPPPPRRAASNSAAPSTVPAPPRVPAAGAPPPRGRAGAPPPR
ncbi:MAG: hypothetical protein OXU20_02815, partial [Myxococcales bacterium]|nr:hypothetical protein [Myxococcales bacterium]